MHKGWSGTFITEKEKIIGNKLKITFRKSYNETTGSEIDIPIKYKHVGGVWREYECFMIGVEWGLIKKAGAWFSFTDAMRNFAKADGVSEETQEFLTKQVQGELNLVKTLEENEELTNYIEAKYKVLAL